MHWSLYVLIGAIVNVLVNTGYKISAAKEGIYMLSAGVLLTGCLTLLALSFLTHENIKLENFLKGWTPLVILGMGVGTGVIMYFFIGAMSRGPLTLVDPMWACVYALTSAAIGMALLKEAPSMTPLDGIGLYMLGAFLRARG